MKPTFAPVLNGVQLRVETVFYVPRPDLVKKESSNSPAHLEKANDTASLRIETNFPEAYRGMSKKLA